MPKRIQRMRTAGWRAPLGAVYVGRPTPWGNPFPVASRGSALFPRADSVRMYRELVLTGETTFRDGPHEHYFRRSDRPTHPLGVPTVDVIRRELAGRDLTCWCPLEDVEGHPVLCHADVLLDIANDPEETQ